MELKWFVGVDWGSQSHQACVLDAAGAVLGEREFKHGGAGLTEMATWLLSFTDGKADEVGVAVETPSGPVVESLLERDFAVHSINPKQLDRFRDRLSPAGAKDDRRDARVLASALRTDPHCLRRLEPTDPAIVELREWSRLGEELTRDRVRLAHRMRQQLWRYYPQFLEAVGDDVAAPWALDLWRSLPTPRAGQRVRGVTLTRVLKQHRIRRRIDAATLRARLRAPAIKLTPGTAEAAATHVRLLVERLALVNRQLQDAERQLDRLVHQLAEAAPADDPAAPATDDPESPTELPDAAILLSLPGVGIRVLATLLTEGGDAVRRRDYGALRCLCGVAPVTRRSGKSLLVIQRRAAHDRLRDAVFHWSRVAVQRDPVSHDKYLALRARGHRGRGCGPRACGRPGEMTPETVAVWLGVPRFRDARIADLTRRPGVAVGLAATATGGELLVVEAACLPGRGQLRVTGRAGPRLRESVELALTWSRAREHGNTGAPKLYGAPVHRADTLRERTNGMTDEAIPHFGSERGHWQARAAAWLADEGGVDIDPEDRSS